MKETTLQEAIIDLYIDIKKEEMSNKYDQACINEDKERLKKAEPTLIVDYLRSAIQLLVSHKSKKTIEALNKELTAKADIEELLRKTEADIRNKIKIQQQLKLYCDTLKQRVNELEKSQNELKQSCQMLQDQLNSQLNKESENKERKEKEITELTTEIENLKRVLTSYENQNLKYADLESKFRTEKINHKDEIKQLEEKVLKLNQQIVQYEDKLKTQKQSKANAQAGKVQNYIEEEEEITQVTHGKMTKIRSSSVTEMPGYQQISVSKKIDGFRRRIEEYNSNMEKKFKIQAEKKRNSSKENSNDSTHKNQNLKFSDESANPLRNSEVMNTIIMKKLNFTNLNNTHSTNNPNSTDRTHHSTQPSNQYKDGSIAQDFIYNKKKKRGANAKETTISPERSSLVMNNRKI